MIFPYNQITQNKMGQTFQTFQTAALYLLPLSLLCAATSIAVLEIGVNIQYSMCKAGMFSPTPTYTCGNGIPERAWNGEIKYYPGEMSTDRCYWGRKLNRWNELPTNHPNQDHLIKRCLGTLTQSNGIPPRTFPEDYNPSWVDPYCLCYCGGLRCSARERWDYSCMEGSRLESESESEFGCSKIRKVIPYGFNTTNGTISDESISYNINRVYGYLWSSILGIVGLSTIYVLCYSNNSYDIHNGIFGYICLLCLYLGIILQIVYLVILIPIQYGNNQLHISDRKNCPLSGVPEYSWRCNQYNTAIMVNIIFHSLTALEIACLLIWIMKYYWKDIKNKIKFYIKKFKIKLYIDKIIIGIVVGIGYIFCVPCIIILVGAIKDMIRTRRLKRENTISSGVELSTTAGGGKSDPDSNVSNTKHVQIIVDPSRNMSPSAPPRPATPPPASAPPLSEIPQPPFTPPPPVPAATRTTCFQWWRRRPPASEPPASEPRSEPAKECIVCLDAPNNWLFGPCGHINLCQACCIKVNSCPICRSTDKNSVRVY